MVLTREAIRNGWIQDLVRRSGSDSRALTDDELNASLTDTLARRPAPGDVWIFAYGSLIWNPAIEFEERRVARIRGWHRSFCLWTNLGRGTPEKPGLMLGLDRGGACAGIAYRLPDAAAHEELSILWRREMVTAAYRPHWVWAHTTQGPVPAIAFVINHAHERYAGKLDEAAIVEAVATACGPLGACRDYLFNTAEHLAELGIGDRRLMRLAEAVRAYSLGVS